MSTFDRLELTYDDYAQQSCPGRCRNCRRKDECGYYWAGPHPGPGVHVVDETNPAPTIWCGCFDPRGE